VRCEGFVYMSDFLHTQLAFSQYIAPLMADFTTADSNDSFVRFFDNGIYRSVVVLGLAWSLALRCPRGQILSP